MSEEVPPSDPVPQNVVPLFQTEVPPTTPTSVLEGALGANLKTVIVIGVTEEGIVYHATSMSQLPLMLWQVERFKRSLFQMGEF